MTTASDMITAYSQPIHNSQSLNSRCLIGRNAESSLVEMESRDQQHQRLHLTSELLSGR